MSAVYSVRVDESVDSRLDFLVDKTGHKKSYFIKKAIQAYLEDKEDYFRAIEALSAMENGEEVSDWDEIKKRLGL
jgi:RHH-type transcriptional regulator, rel operon repressor / antitoxin RelB